MMIFRINYLFKAIAWNHAASLCRYDYDAQVCDAFAKKYWNLFLRGKNVKKRTRVLKSVDKRTKRSNTKELQGF